MVFRHAPIPRKGSGNQQQQQQHGVQSLNNPEIAESGDGNVYCAKTYLHSLGYIANASKNRFSSQKVFKSLRKNFFNLGYTVSAD